MNFQLKIVVHYEKSRKKLKHFQLILYHRLISEKYFLPERTMEIFQELHCAVKSTYTHFTEHISTDKFQPKEHINKADNKKDNFSVDTVNLIIDLKMNFLF